MIINYRPIVTWPGEQTKFRQRSPFSAPWNATLDLLDRELHHLNAKSVVFQVALREEDFRRTDGQPKANSRASHPGVILAFDSKHGPLKYACDTYQDFQSNIRAITLGLEALRKVDRYGITKRGEQYTGWKALPGTVEAPVMSVEAAAGLIADLAAKSNGLQVARAMLLEDAELAGAAYRVAAKLTHPDAGGDAGEFQRLQEARRILMAHHGSR